MPRSQPDKQEKPKLYLSYGIEMRYFESDRQWYVKVTDQSRVNGSWDLYAGGRIRPLMVKVCAWILDHVAREQCRRNRGKTN